MNKRKIHIKFFAILLATVALLSNVTIPCSAKTISETRTGAGGKASIQATLQYNLSNGIVSSGKIKKVKKNSSWIYWACSYCNHSKSAYRYNSNRYYAVKTSGLWMTIESKGGNICNVTIKGYRNGN